MKKKAIFFVFFQKKLRFIFQVSDNILAAFAYSGEADMLLQAVDLRELPTMFTQSDCAMSTKASKRLSRKIAQDINDKEDNVNIDAGHCEGYLLYDLRKTRRQKLNLGIFIKIL